MFYVTRDLNRYRRCKFCEHLFLDPMPSDVLLKELYSNDYDFRVDSTSHIRFEEVAQKVIDRLKRINPSGKSLLDVGTGYGTFVELAVSNGLEAMGIEPAKNLYQAANSKIGKKILHTDLNKFAKFTDQMFDFISAIHVIEHLKEPGKFLMTVMNLLKPGGVLYIETPNSGSHLATFEMENYTFLTPPDHVNLFTESSFKALVEGSVEITYSSYNTYSYPEHLVGILRIIKNGRSHRKLTIMQDGKSRSSGEVAARNTLPFFDRVMAPFLTPLLNIGNRGSFLQVYIQKKN